MYSKCTYRELSFELILDTAFIIVPVQYNIFHAVFGECGLVKNLNLYNLTMLAAILLFQFRKKIHLFMFTLYALNCIFVQYSHATIDNPCL